MIHKLSDDLTSAIESEGWPLYVVGNDGQEQYVIIPAGVYQAKAEEGMHQSYDVDALRAAILNRRDESRRLNQDWQSVDAETWDPRPAASPGEA